MSYKYMYVHGALCYEQLHTTSTKINRKSDTRVLHASHILKILYYKHSQCTALYILYLRLAKLQSNLKVLPITIVQSLE